MWYASFVSTIAPRAPYTGLGDSHSHESKNLIGIESHGHNPLGMLTSLEIANYYLHSKWPACLDFETLIFSIFLRGWGVGRGFGGGVAIICKLHDLHGCTHNRSVYSVQATTCSEINNMLMCIDFVLIIYFWCKHVHNQWVAGCRHWLTDKLRPVVNNSAPWHLSWAGQCWPLDHHRRSNEISTLRTLRDLSAEICLCWLSLG